MILFSTGCPKCMVLEKKMNQKGIQYVISTDIQELLDMGIRRAPILKTDDGEYLDFSDAVKLVNTYGDCE